MDLSRAIFGLVLALVLMPACKKASEATGDKGQSSQAHMAKSKKASSPPSAPLAERDITLQSPDGQWSFKLQNSGARYQVHDAAGKNMGTVVRSMVGATFKDPTGKTLGQAQVHGRLITLPMAKEWSLFFLPVRGFEMKKNDKKVVHFDGQTLDLWGKKAGVTNKDGRQSVGKVKGEGGDSRSIAVAAILELPVESRIPLMFAVLWAPNDTR